MRMRVVCVSCDVCVAGAHRGRERTDPRVPPGNIPVLPILGIDVDMSAAAAMIAHMQGPQLTAAARPSQSDSQGRRISLKFMQRVRLQARQADTPVRFRRRAAV